ncbi:hypothetical protein LTR37_014674 [Vermiconidia calcicola]|uniref:Uncharacterized protein n=1 Tax=Vermiconidia calcicola TaxID=1690605 RepID=A0ACC3MUC1_9PEZI|nr:hypothetical protein LTR37_014674 [Vermiconidia calcicola]
MTFREKAVWCQLACNVLALGILLPPVGTKESDAELRRQALAHVESVWYQEQRLHNELRMKQKQRQRSWPSLHTTLRRSDILQYAKFSLVYVECGLFEKAQELLLQVDGFLTEAVGLAHPVAIKARLFLSETCWWLTDGDAAARLRQELLTTCQSSLGNDDVATLTVVDRLGKSMWQLGKFQRAKDLSQQAVDGFQKLYPSGHGDTYRAMTHLGLCVGKLARFDQAIALHSGALEGLVRAEPVSEYNAHVLEVQENLAMAKLGRHRYGASQDNDLRAAVNLQADVFSQREQKLGKEHPLSLWAACNLARLKAACGQLADAEEMIRQRLPIAERTLGPDHMVAFLLDCYRRQKKTTEAGELEDMVLKGTRDIFGEGSAWEHFFIVQYTTNARAGAEQEPQTQDNNVLNPYDTTR